MRILLEGRPGSGKSTITRRLADTLSAQGIPLTGFATEEIRERGRGIGFSIERLGGERGALAHDHLIAILEALHDLAHPVETLRPARAHSPPTAGSWSSMSA